ncbi:glutamine amidotransferase [Ligilactobacillus salitolerans]|uniref:Glutamine amidotransferase n=1 Tax=Ligilactobacillus salitolerans TaxID=1808352 RepID=A0A401IT68_9LACO|nr:gamma-glutamyl-gamma-aminobutyrate hydrolase family protein [Ligilactobacillus salitolerans]GBG94718.1 glutamine amidotransferase [Ligilactobacillus salitolerans]
MKPFIGMPSDSDPKIHGFTDYIDDNVAQAIIKAGGVPVILPPNNSEEIAKDYVKNLDGIAFLGGPDIDPTLFGEEPIAKIGSTSLIKDKFEIALCRQAYQAGKAIFGICRGIQIISVALGGTVFQDFPSQSEDAFIKHHQDAPIFYPSHHITTEAGTKAETILGDHPYVNSHHHQTVKEPGTELFVSGRAADHAVEVVESKKNDQVLAVQWHPEFLFDTKPEEMELFRDFVERSKKSY